MELLFVCEANTCRSAMAEKIAQALALEAGLENVHTRSAGLQAAQLRAILPRQAAKIQPLSPAGEIADPRRPEDYDSVYEQLETALGVRLAEWK